VQEGVRIVSLCVLAAIAYGIVHDNVTARICVEYFTVFHPPVPWVGSEPTALALYWGSVASWWMGLGLGVPLAVFARWGRPPHVTAADLIRPLSRLLVIMAVGSAIAGGIGYLLASNGVLTPARPWVDRIDPATHTLFLLDLWAHNAAYTIGFVGGIILWGWCVRFRQRPSPAARTQH
jgi:hypothetical protein